MKIKNNKFLQGSSSVEIMAVVVFVIGIMIGFSGYLQRGFSGHWKATGDTFGQGRQYDPREFGTGGEGGGTLDCFFDQASQKWINEDLYRKNNCDCTLVKFDGSPLPDYQLRCIDCKVLSEDSLCQ